MISIIKNSKVQFEFPSRDFQGAGFGENACLLLPSGASVKGSSEKANFELKLIFKAQSTIVYSTFDESSH